MKTYMTGSQKLNKGFTLIEMVVSLAIFGLLIFVIVGIFLNAQSSQIQSAALTTAADNVRLALERMAREIRTSFSFPSGSSQVFATSSLSFTNSFGQNITYSLGLCAGQSQNNCIKKSANGGSNQDITANSLNIDNLNFIVANSSCSTPNSQTLINIYVEAELFYNSQTSTISLQTSIMPRALKICGS